MRGREAFEFVIIERGVQEQDTSVVTFLTSVWVR
jgi:hypothetical protein